MQLHTQNMQRKGKQTVYKYWRDESRGRAHARTPSPARACGAVFLFVKNLCLVQNFR